MSNQTPDNSEPTLPLLRQERENVVDFGGLCPLYYAPMHYPTEVELYEPSFDPHSAALHENSRQPAATVKVQVPLPCGHFNIWRPLHDRRAPVAARLARFFVGSAALQPDGRVVAPNNSTWDSRISYSSADDEYYENGHVLPVINGWRHGTLAARSLFRKVEHDWMMTYLAPEQGNSHQQPLAVWRFNYAESRRAVERFHAVLGFSLFAESAAVEWCVRPLSSHRFRRIPIHVLTPEEARYFSEIGSGDSGESHADDSLEQRARIIEQYCGQILAYRASSNEYNDYVVHSVPALAADLTQYVEGEYGFELAVSFVPASEGPDGWQKAQVARQSLHHPISGRMREGEDALSRCGLDFRIKLRDDIVVPPVSVELTHALTATAPEQRLCMDGPGCNFTICVRDPENTVGSLQPPIGAHEHVLRAGSEYFAALLESDMAESSSKQVELEGMPYGPVRSAIYFLYADSVPREESMDLNDWIVLLDVASRLSIPRLHQLSQARILAEVVPDTLATLQDPSDEDSYKVPAEYPDLETIELLQGVAADTGAHDLAQALDRLVAYYPIEVCENRIRSSPVGEFVPPPPHHMGTHDHDPGIRFAVGRAQGPFGRGPFGHHDFEIEGGDPHGPVQMPIMAGPAIHPEIAPGFAHAGGNHRGVHDGGFLGRLLGNWRLTNIPNNGHADPPAPQPGPVPDVPHATHAHMPPPESDSESD
ncbi:Peptide-N(4)-(N-acetyl-beta- glucosaminyl)asparagine amidase [Coemansia sp. RSA 355]|nr:Peptide-N(4)-(N-acetyl-beta- glucosaminyl)asparagine amidase [Coemansia sp. RSA 355]